MQQFAVLLLTARAGWRRSDVQSADRDVGRRLKFWFIHARKSRNIKAQNPALANLSRKRQSAIEEPTET